MAKRSERNEKPQVQVGGELVVVTFVESQDKAKEYQGILLNNDIPSSVKNCDEDSVVSKTFAVMVPEDYLDEAHVVIESQDAYDDFYDYALEDEEDFDNDFMNDDEY